MVSETIRGLNSRGTDATIVPKSDRLFNAILLIVHVSISLATEDALNYRIGIIFVCKDVFLINIFTMI